MRQIVLYATGSGTANAAAQVTIPSRSRLVGVIASVRFDQVADNSNCALEISKASATELAVNAAQQRILAVGSFANLVTSGLSQSSINQFFPVDVQLEQGQIVYLHAVVTTTTYYAEFILQLV